MTQYLLCDLKDDPELIAEYEAYHASGQVWPEVTATLRAAGISRMEIYRAGNRLVMVMETDETYSKERHDSLASQPKVVAWEALMDRFQQRLPFANHDLKWVPMNQIFDLGEQ